MSEVKPVLYLGTKLVPYEERTFRIADLRDAMGYTHDHKQFYSEEQVQKLLAENERLRAEAAREFERSARLGGQLHESQVRAERLAEALRWISGDDTAKGCDDGMQEVEAIKQRAHAALDQEGGKGGAGK